MLPRDCVPVPQQAMLALFLSVAANTPTNGAADHASAMLLFSSAGGRHLYKRIQVSRPVQLHGHENR